MGNFFLTLDFTFHLSIDPNCILEGSTRWNMTCLQGVRLTDEKITDMLPCSPSKKCIFGIVWTQAVTQKWRVALKLFELNKSPTNDNRALCTGNFAATKFNEAKTILALFNWHVQTRLNEQKLSSSEIPPKSYSDSEARASPFVVFCFSNQKTLTPHSAADWWTWKNLLCLYFCTCGPNETISKSSKFTSIREEEHNNAPDIS